MIEQIFIIALCVLSIHYTMQEGEIFSFVGDFFYRYLPSKLHPSIFECNVCMCPWYGSVIFWFAPWHHVLWQWPFIVIGAMGINIVINKFNKEDEPRIETGNDPSSEINFGNSE